MENKNLILEKLNNRIEKYAERKELAEEKNDRSIEILYEGCIHAMEQAIDIIEICGD